MKAPTFTHKSVYIVSIMTKIYWPSSNSLVIKKFLKRVPFFANTLHMNFDEIAQHDGLADSD